MAKDNKAETKELNATPGLYAGKRWRKTRRFDVFITGFGIVAFALIFAYNVLNTANSTGYRVFTGLLWGFLLVFQVRSFQVVLAKYRSGEEIMAGWFADVRAKKESK